MLTVPARGWTASRSLSPVISDSIVVGALSTRSAAAAKMRLGELLVLDQFHVARGDAQVALGQHHVQVGQQRAEERPGAVHLLQQRQALAPARCRGAEPGLDGAAEAGPARQRHAALAPAEKPQGMARRSSMRRFGLARGRARADVQLGDLADRRGLEEVVGEARRAVDQRAVGLVAGLADVPRRPPGRPWAGSWSGAAAWLPAWRPPGFPGCAGRSRGCAYLDAITSPCSVRRICPFTVPGGCARIAW